MKPVLILGWGPDGCEDVDRIADALGHDQSMDCAKGEKAHSRDVLKQIAEWLKDNEYAHVLYIGAHGLEHGLGPTANGRDKLGYGELSDVIHDNISPKAPPLTVMLGACESSVAARGWNTLKQDAIGLLIAFRDRPTSSTVQDVLIEFLTQGDQLLPGVATVPKEIVYLDEGVARLQKLHPNVAIYHKGKKKELGDVDLLPQSGAASLLGVLEAEGAVNPGSLLWEAAVAASKITDAEVAEGNESKPKKRARLKVRKFGRR